MSKLYEIANEYAELANSDMDAEMIADTLEGIAGEFEIKAENILALIKNETALEEALKAEAKTLTERARVSANKVKNLKDYIASSMETMELKKLNAGVHAITVRKGVQSVQIDNLEQIPSDFVTIETTTKPDKNLIKSKLKLGEHIEGASLVTGKSSLIIK
ncbi:hypothetical protein NVP1148O_34 [Vibrio phage 1.148.O._10N.286.54.A10]|nr:hypothetical protein NVP1148O_34 [Vibrio phage 1.148.O._10N.286.54.A10]